ncbi:MAG: hypothetical protein RR956_06320 [Christensenella sp.]
MDPIALFGIITIGSMVVLFVVCLILYCRIQQKRHFLCPRCGARFKVAGMRTFFVHKKGVDRMLTCPRCGMVDYMENIHDEDYTPEMQAADAQKDKEEREAREQQEDE